MPRYDYSCPTHGIFEVSLPLRKWDTKKPCPKCKKPSEQVLLPTRARNEFAQPIVIHVSSDGQKFRFPGAPDAKMPPGFVKRELKSVREVEKFERQMNARLRSEADRHHENEERAFAPILSARRSELRQVMQRMSPAGRAFAEFAIAFNNARKRKSTECGFHVSLLHDDSSKHPWIDERTGWKRKYL